MAVAIIPHNLPTSTRFLGEKNYIVTFILYYLYYLFKILYVLG